MQDCLFCKIINGEIPSYKIYEDEFTYAFLDIADDFVGHTLVLPKKHCKNLIDADAKTLNSVFNTVQKISKHYIENCGYDGVNVFNNNNECSGQSVNHFHVHIVPRKNNDNISVFANIEKKNSNFNEILNLLKLN